MDPRETRRMVVPKPGVRCLVQRLCQSALCTAHDILRVMTHFCPRSWHARTMRSYSATAESSHDVSLQTSSMHRAHWSVVARPVGEHSWSRSEADEPETCHVEGCVVADMLEREHAAAQASESGADEAGVSAASSETEAAAEEVIPQEVAQRHSASSWQSHG